MQTISLPQPGDGWQGNLFSAMVISSLINVEEAEAYRHTTPFSTILFTRAKFDKIFKAKKHTPPDQDEGPERRRMVA
jgi:hypothetical protein